MDAKKTLVWLLRTGYLIWFRYYTIAVNVYDKLKGRVYHEKM